MSMTKLSVLIPVFNESKTIRTVIDAVIADPSIEAVLVLTPPDSHLAIAERCLLAGKHVLVEKPLATSTQQVLELMAEGRSNAGIARRLWLAEATVEKHIRNILTKLHLPLTDDDHRRVRAVITYLKAG